MMDFPTEVEGINSKTLEEMCQSLEQSDYYTSGSQMSVIKEEEGEYKLSCSQMSDVC